MNITELEQITDWLEKNKFSGINVDGNPVYKKVDVEAKLLELQKENEELKEKLKQFAGKDLLWFQREEVQGYLKESSDHVLSIPDIQANAIEEALNRSITGAIANEPNEDKQEGFFWLHGWLEHYANKLREGNSNE